jgi:hypothetical protein
MVVFGESETSEILANCHPRDLRSHVIVLTLAHNSGAVFRRWFMTSRKGGFNKLWFIRYSRRFAFKRTQKCTWLMRTSLSSPSRCQILWPFKKIWLHRRIYMWLWPRSCHLFCTSRAVIVNGNNPFSNLLMGSSFSVNVQDPPLNSHRRSMPIVTYEISAG